jgi:ATP/maltotriose-dependent transcriptional regulator MalT
MAEWSVTGTERDVLLATKLYLPGQPVRGGQVAWLSLDAGDNDPARFWRHVVAALDRARPATGDRVAPLLGPPAARPTAPRPSPGPVS